MHFLNLICKSRQLVNIGINLSTVVDLNRGTSIENRTQTYYSLLQISDTLTRYVRCRLMMMNNDYYTLNIQCYELRIVTNIVYLFIGSSST